MNNAIDNILEHYGKKGMKWGARKSGNTRDSKRTVFGKSPKKLTSSELESRIRRMEMEKKYNDLNRKDVSKGKAMASEVLSGAGKKVATTVLTGAALYTVKKVVAKKLGEDAASMITKRK